MAKIDKHFDFLNLANKTTYDYKAKTENINNDIAYMLNRSNTMFKYHDLPETIPETEIEKLLQINGFCIIGKINDKLYALNGGVGGETDVYNNPTQAVISVPYLNYNATWEIDKNCVLIKNDCNALGLLPMYAKYCTLLNESTISLVLALVNRRVQSFISAKDDNTKKSADEFINKVFNGELSIIADNALFDALKVQNNTLNNSNALTEIYNLMVGLKKDLYNEIGLASYNSEKKERISNAELELNADNLYPLVDDMRNRRIEGIEKVNKMFNTEIKVEFNSSWDYRILNGESIHNTDTEINKNDIPDNKAEDNNTDSDNSNNDTNNDTNTDSDKKDKEGDTE